MYHFTTHSEAETIALAQKIAPFLKARDCLAFFATLGTGKSVFCRALIQTLIPEVKHVPSPTFTLVQTYDQYDPAIWHFDLYRLKDPEEIHELGIDEAFSTSITLIEWAQNMEDFLPQNTFKIYIQNGSLANERNITIHADKKYADWLDDI